MLQHILNGRKLLSNRANLSCQRGINDSLLASEKESPACTCASQHALKPAIHDESCTSELANSLSSSLRFSPEKHHSEFREDNPSTSFPPKQTGNFRSSENANMDNAENTSGSENGAEQAFLEDFLALDSDILTSEGIVDVEDLGAISSYPFLNKYKIIFFLKIKDAILPNHIFDHRQNTR